jgi:hypothetical protein
MRALARRPGTIGERKGVSVSVTPTNGRSSDYSLGPEKGANRRKEPTYIS